MGSMIRDLRVSLRSLARRPGFTAVPVLTFSLGVGACIAMLSVLNGVVLRPLPYPESEEIVRIYCTDFDGRRASWSAGNFVDFTAQTTSYEAVAGYQSAEFSARENGLPAGLDGATVTSEFFRVFGVAPAAGRLIDPSADAPGDERVSSGPRSLVLLAAQSTRASTLKAGRRSTSPMHSSRGRS